MRRDLLLLVACQALLMTGGVVLASTGALVGARLAPRETLATLPLALFNVAIMTTAIPASMLMKRIGRRFGFALGGLIGMAGAALAALGAMRVGFAAFCGGMAILGVSMAFGGFYRFAAAEAVPAESRGRAIGYVTAGGVVAAFAGTWIAQLTRSIPGIGQFGGSYVVLAVTAASTVVLALLLTIPTPTAEECARCGRPLLEIARQPGYVVAVAVAALGYGVMTLIMNATPLAMRAQAYTFGVTAFVIQWHVLGMFAPSFVTGRLIDLFGLPRVLLAGGALMTACIATNLLGHGRGALWIALLALGVGWNLLFVGGTTLLTRMYAPEERSKSQGLNDFFVYLTIAAAALGAGEIMGAWGWRAVNLIALPGVVLILTAIAWLARREPSASR